MKPQSSSKALILNSFLQFARIFQIFFLFLYVVIAFSIRLENNLHSDSKVPSIPFILNNAQQNIPVPGVLPEDKQLNDTLAVRPTVMLMTFVHTEH